MTSNRFDSDAAREALEETARDAVADADRVAADAPVVDPDIGFGPYGTPSTRAWTRWRDRMKARGQRP